MIVYLLLLLLFTIRARTDTSPHHTRMRRTKDGRGAGTVFACIETVPAYTPHPPVIRTCTRRKPRRRLAIVVNYQGFFYAAPSDGIYTGFPSHLSPATTGFCPDDVPPFELLVGSDKPTPMRVIRWSDNAYITHHCAAAGHNPATLEHSAHEQLAAACNVPYCFTFCRSVRGRPLARRPVCRTDFYRAGAGHNRALCASIPQ